MPKKSFQPAALGLIHTCCLLRAEALERISTLQLFRYPLDLFIIDNVNIWPTWLFAPLQSADKDGRIDSVEIRICFVGRPRYATPTESDGPYGLPTEIFCILRRILCNAIRGMNSWNTFGSGDQFTIGIARLCIDPEGCNSGQNLAALPSRAYARSPHALAEYFSAGINEQLALFLERPYPPYLEFVHEDSAEVFTRVGEVELMVGDFSHSFWNLSDILPLAQNGGSHLA